MAKRVTRTVRSDGTEEVSVTTKHGFFHAVGVVLVVGFVVTMFAKHLALDVIVLVAIGLAITGKRRG